MAIALQESEARYRAVVEGSLQGMYIHQNDFIIRFANQALVRLFGYDSAEALLGQEIWVLVPRTSARGWKAIVKRVCRARRPPPTTSGRGSIEMGPRSGWRVSSPVCLGMGKRLSWPR